jgi:protein-L-isoaspartate(D-aspartate) O-methyltransferase
LTTDRSLLEATRLAYAQQVCRTAETTSQALLTAFATVPREHFLGPGPWSILTAQTACGGSDYSPSPSADPVHLYEDVLVAIDLPRKLNNGHPSFLAFCLNALQIQAGERIIHIGCGVGYYTAIIAEIVGGKGHVIGVEIDPLLALRARQNLSYLPQIEVEHADGSTLSSHQVDAIFVNAGVTEIRSNWLDILADGGRMLIPVTAQLESNPDAELGLGRLLKITRLPKNNIFAAQFISTVGIYHCSGARNPQHDNVIRAGLSRGEAEAVRSLRRDVHMAERTCWYHSDTFCLSTLDACHSGTGDEDLPVG